MPLTLPRPSVDSARPPRARLSMRRPVRAAGTSEEGDGWTVTMRRTSLGVHTRLHITTRDGALCPAGAQAALGVPPGQAMRVSGGREAVGPAWLVLRLHHGVAAVQVRLSDNTLHDLDIHTDPNRLPIGVSVLLYPRTLDVHRIDAFDQQGRAIDIFR